MKDVVTRRDLFAQSAVALATAITSGARAETATAGTPDTKSPAAELLRISLNTSTLRGHKLPIVEVIDIAAKAGYAGVEPWMDEVQRYVDAGGALKDLGNRLKDKGLAVTGAIAFYHWMVDDASQRAQALEQAKRWMSHLAEIGGTRIAAPPAGDVKTVDLLKAAERYGELLKVGDLEGVVPAVEIWGWASNLYRLGQAVLVALEARHPRACVLPDVFHLYKGGAGLSGIALMNPKMIAGFHLNDYPANPPRETIADKDRVYPGDGIAPLKRLIQDLRTIGYRGPVSVELFNPDLSKQDPAVVAKTALEKTQAVIRAAMATQEPNG
jgi:sugar phosphate isomerase/epimerase